MENQWQCQDGIDHGADLAGLSEGILEPQFSFSGAGDDTFKAILTDTSPQAGHQTAINGFTNGFIVFLWKMARELDFQHYFRLIGLLFIPVDNLTDLKSFS